MAKKIDDSSWNFNTQPDPGGQMGGGFPSQAGMPQLPGSNNGNKGDTGNNTGDKGDKGDTGSGGGGGGGGGGGYTPPAAPSYDENTKLDIPEQTPVDPAKRAELNPSYEEKTIDRVQKYDKQPMVDMATQQIELARQQYNQQINQSMDTNAADLNRAIADAQGQFQTQQNQITANEMNALDNAALYAEARGDKGGIGYAQYNNIQNTAAQNRQAVSQAQTKLATDTARQIADLRAKGENG